VRVSAHTVAEAEGMGGGVRVPAHTVAEAERVCLAPCPSPSLPQLIQRQKPSGEAPSLPLSLSQSIPRPPVPRPPPSRSLPSEPAIGLVSATARSPASSS